MKIRSYIDTVVEPLVRPAAWNCYVVAWIMGTACGQAPASRKTARRVVAKVEFHAGELLARVGFIVTNLETPSRAVVRFHNKRGTAEQWIKEGKQTVKMILS